MYIWSTVIVLSKFTFYLGFVCIAGYTFFGHVFEQVAQDQKAYTPIPSYLKLPKAAILIAFIGSLIWFFANTGAMAEEGVSGALDAEMIDIMWDSSIGEVALVRIVGLAIAILAFFLSTYTKSDKLTRNLTRIFSLLSLLILSYSFTLLGHVSELGTLEKVTLLFHVLIMAWWMGALLPLRLSCDFLAYGDLYVLMDKFGKQASIMVGLLLVAGLWLTIQLVGRVDALLSSNYGQVLLLKLFVIIGILSLATKHKLKLVPALKKSSERSTLSHSISVEIILALVIFLITATLTSVVGPQA